MNTFSKLTPDLYSNFECLGGGDLLTGTVLATSARDLELIEKDE